MQAAGGIRLRALNTEPLQIQLINKYIHYPDWIILDEVLVQALGEQSDLRAVLTFDVSLHGRLSSRRGVNFIPIAYAEEAFSHGQDPLPPVTTGRFRAAENDLRICISEVMFYFAAAISACTASGNPFGNGTSDAV